jgi:DNA replication and repair protein RecF
MRLGHLEVRNVRILAELDCTPGDRLNVFVGANGSGKTSILESIHILGSGRSFRTHRLGELVSRGESWLRARGALHSDDGAATTVGVEKGPEGLRIRVAGEAIGSASELARQLPMVVITPDSQRLLTDGAELRRQLMDWALFHVEPGYLAVLHRYRRALRQRNAALRESAGPTALSGWDRELAEAGEGLHGQRDRFLANILPFYAETLEGLVPMVVEIDYRAGWDTAVGLREALDAGAATDRARGFTGRGPHRADLRFQVDGAPASQLLSRGEGKLFVVGLVLAQARFLERQQGRPPLVLVDDIASELDEDSRGRFFAQLQALGAQGFVTTVSMDLVKSGYQEGFRVFHVERGKPLKMV